MRKKFDLSSLISRVTKIAKNPDFRPSTMDAGYNIWAHRGLIYIAQLFHGQNMKSFEQLKKEFNLPAQDLYTFLQIRHYLQKHKEWDNIHKIPSKLEELLIALIEKETKKGLYQKYIKHYNMNRRAVIWTLKKVGIRSKYHNNR